MLNTVWLIIVAFGLSACSAPPEEELALLAPELPDAMREHLARDDEGDFTRYCEEQGITAILDARTILRRALDRHTPATYRTSWRSLAPYLRRLAHQLTVTYGCANFQAEHAYWDGLSPEAALALLRREDQLQALYLDADPLLDEKIQRLAAHAQAFRAAGYWSGVVWCRAAGAEFAAALGRDADEDALIREALRISRGQTMPIMEARLLMMLGDRFRERAVVDSMAAAWREALALGERHRLPEQSAAVHAHWAEFYADQGRLALAADHHRSAQEVCRRYRGGYLELPFVLDAMYFHAELGFWEVVGRLLEHARVLQRLLKDAPRPVQRRSYDLHLREMEARYLSALGAVDEAELLYEQLEQATEAPTFRMNYPRLMYARAEGLLAAGRPTEALPIIGKGLVQALARSLPGTRARFTSLLARTLWTLGNRRATERTLRDFTQQAEALGGPGETLLRREWLFHDACRAQLALTDRNRAQARRFLEQGLARLGEYVRAIDASEEGYMFLESAQDLRWALHDYVGQAPGPSYLLESAWNELPSLLGAATREAGEGSEGGVARRSPFAPVSRSPLDALRSVLEDPGTEELEIVFRFFQSQRARHVLFAVHLGSVLRWIAAEDGVRRDTLALSPETLRGELDAALAALSRDPGALDAPPEDSLAARLGGLCRHLLAGALDPGDGGASSGGWISEAEDRARDSVRSGAGDHGGRAAREASPSTRTRPLLLVTPDGLLEQLPFEALNLAWPDERAPAKPAERGQAGRDARAPAGPAERGQAADVPAPIHDPPSAGIIPYRPLLAEVDVAYLRSPRFETPPMVGPRGLVVSDPSLAPSHLRRYPALQTLSGTEAETARIREHFPAALALRREEATKAAILSAWPEAPFFYAAAHFVRDPEVPYVTFLPVAPPVDAYRPDQTQLGVQDVRSLDLRRCQLVVLSGCATGAAYSIHGRQAPSLGDACLDAGAETVIETFWYVRDDDAHLLMGRFIDRWAGQRTWAVRALNEARRARLRGAHGYRHPFTWAAYVVTMGHL